MPIVAAVRSLRSRLFVLWLLSLAASLAVGVLLVGLYRQSATVRLSGAEQTVAEACDAIAERYGYYAAGWAGPPSGQPDAAFRADLATVVDFALSPYPGIAGGIWQPDSGVLASTSVLSEQLRGALAALVAQASSDDEPEEQQLSADGATLVLQACPLRGPVAALAAFALARVEAAPAAGPSRLPGPGHPASTGARDHGAADLAGGCVVAPHRRHRDRTGPTCRWAAGRTCLRLANVNRTASSARSTWPASLAGGRAAPVGGAVGPRRAAERLAALGRAAAGVAHEIRNPIARPMRLQGRERLAGDDTRRRAALDAILAQIARLDRLLAELLDHDPARASLRRRRRT